MKTKIFIARVSLLAIAGLIGATFAGQAADFRLTFSSTDGGGGSADDPAGALADGTSAARAKERGLDPAAFLADNDSTGFFEPMGDLLCPGPTFTNVNDFRVILVDSPMEPARNP